MQSHPASLAPAHSPARLGPITQFGNPRRQLRYERRQLLHVMTMPVDRTIVELLAHLRVARRRRVAAPLVKCQASGFEREFQVVEQAADFRRGLTYQILVA